MTPLRRTKSMEQAKTTDSESHPESSLTRSKSIDLETNHQKVKDDTS